MRVHLLKKDLDTISAQIIRNFFFIFLILE